MLERLLLLRAHGGPVKTYIRRRLQTVGNLGSGIPIPEVGKSDYMVLMDGRLSISIGIMTTVRVSLILTIGAALKVQEKFLKMDFPRGLVVERIRLDAIDREYWNDKKCGTDSEL